MTVARTVADVLAEHVVVRGGVHRPDVPATSTCRSCSTRPGWSATCTGSWGCRSPRRRRWPGSPTRSAPRCTGSPATSGVPWVDFAKGQRKDDVMHEHLAAFTGAEGVLFIGRAQEKTTLFRTEKRRDAERDDVSVDREDHRAGQPVLLLLRGRRFRPVLPEVLLLLPVQRQAVHQRQPVGQAPGRQGRDRRSPRWTTGSPPSTTRPRCRRSATGSDREQIDALLRKWLAILPHPFTAADRAAGYRYDISILQAEFSLTQMLDQPVSGRVFFEQVIRDNLDIGRPDQVSLIFDRRLMRQRPHARPRAGSAPG